MGTDLELQHEDWWNNISDIERQTVNKGIADADAGKVQPYSKAFSIYKKWL